MKLWFFAEDGRRMIGCVDCSVAFARQLARLYNDDPATMLPIDVIADSADLSSAGLTIPVRPRITSGRASD